MPVSDASSPPPSTEHSSNDTPLVSAVLLVGFHAKHGNEVEWMYPAAEWLARDHPLQQGVALHALPDGVHNRMSDTVYFHLRTPNSRSDWYAVACYRQRALDARSTNHLSGLASVSRGTVQKAAVLLSRRPAYAALAQRLAPVMSQYFAENDFGRVERFVDLVQALNAAPPSPALSAPINTAATALFLAVGRDLLCLLKLVLLERRILVVGAPTERVGNTVLGIAACFPGEMEQEEEDWRRRRRVEDESVRLGLFRVPTLHPGKVERPSEEMDAGHSTCLDLEPYVPLQRLREMLRMDKAEYRHAHQRSPEAVGRAAAVDDAESEGDADDLETWPRSRRGFVAGAASNTGKLYRSACRSARLFEGSPNKSLLVPPSPQRRPSRPRRPSSPSAVPTRTADERSPGTPARTTSGGAWEYPDALVDLESQRVYFTPAASVRVALTRREKRFVEQLSRQVILAGMEEAPAEMQLRRALHRYVQQLVTSVTALSDVSDRHLASLGGYFGGRFLQAWTRETHNFARVWKQRAVYRAASSSANVAKRPAANGSAAFDFAALGASLSEWLRGDPLTSDATVVEEEGARQPMLRHPARRPPEWSELHRGLRQVFRWPGHYEDHERDTVMGSRARESTQITSRRAGHHPTIERVGSEDISQSASPPGEEVRTGRAGTPWR